MYAEMSCIFPLVLTTMKRNWKVKICKDLRRELVIVKGREKSDKNIREFEFREITHFPCVFVKNIYIQKLTHKKIKCIY